MLINRRQFINTSLGTLALGILPSKPNVKKHGIAVVGLGGQGKRIVQELLWLSKTHPLEIVGLSDIESDTLAEVSKWLPHAQLTQDYREISKWQHVQAVVIATPDDTHASIAETMLAAGYDLYLEPPLARTSQAAQNLLELAQQHGNLIQVGIHQMQHSAYIMARDLISSHQLGKINRIEIAIPAETLPTPPHWQLFREHSEGQIALLLTEVFELIRFMVNATPSQVTAQSGIFLAQDGRTNPDTFTALLTYTQGFLLNFSVGIGKSLFNIYGTEGTLDLRSGQLTLQNGQIKYLNISPENTLRKHLAEWLRCLDSRQQPQLPIQAGYQQMQFIEAVFS